MAIRPVDLQLAYMSAPQNAAVLNAAQEAPQAAQAAAAAQFAAELAEREEQIEEPSTITGAKVRRREQRDPGDRDSYEASQESSEAPFVMVRPPNRGALNLAGEGEHFIDVTA
jgi:hypothetical protein